MIAAMRRLHTGQEVPLLPPPQATERVVRKKPFLFAERSRHFDANVFSVVDIIIIVVVVVLVLGAPLPLPAMSSSSAACRDAAETEGEENMMPLSFSPVLSFFVAPQKCGGEYDGMMMMMMFFFFFYFYLVSLARRRRRRNKKKKEPKNKQTNKQTNKQQTKTKTKTKTKKEEEFYGRILRQRRIFRRRRGTKKMEIFLLFFFRFFSFLDTHTRGGRYLN